MTFQHVVRRKTADDDVLSPGQAAEVMPMTRQGITKAIREGRIPGFQEPGSNRWWAERFHVEARVVRGATGQTAGGVGDDPVSLLTDRIRALEVQVEDLAETVQTAVRVSSHASGADCDRSELQARLNTANAVIVEMNAASRPAENAATARREAVTAMAMAIEHLQKLATEQASEIDLLRNAVAQMAIPDSLA